MYPITELQNAFFSFLTKLSPEFSLHRNAVTFILQTDPKKSSFGDISSNAPLILARPLKKHPAALAKEICAAFSHQFVAKIEPAGPGFLNMWLSDKAMEEIARNLFIHKQTFFKPEQVQARSFGIEFVSANPTGPLHLGHGRGGILGDVLSRVLQFFGNKVTKEYYINDAGTQIQWR